MAEINKRDTGFIIDNGDGLSGKAFKEDISKYFEDYNVKNQRYGITIYNHFIVKFKESSSNHKTQLIQKLK